MIRFIFLFSGRQKSGIKTLLKVRKEDVVMDDVEFDYESEGLNL